MTARCHLSSVGCKPHDSFTILELLVASAVTVLIAGVVLSLSSSVLRNWGRSHGALTAEGQARAALDRLSLDLCGALYCDDGNVWLAVTVQPEASVSGLGANGTKPVGPSLNPAASNLMDARFGVASVWLRFFTVAQGTDPRSNDPAATVAVSYQMLSGINASLPVGRSASINLRTPFKDRTYQAYAGTVLLEGSDRALLLLLPPYHQGSLEVQSRVLLDTPQGEPGNVRR